MSSIDSLKSYNQQIQQMGMSDILNGVQQGNNLPSILDINPTSKKDVVDYPHTSSNGLTLSQNSKSKSKSN